jgi:hypothetical protein
MLCPVCKRAEMQQVAETSPLNLTFKCLECGAEAIQAASDNASEKNQFKAVFALQPDGSMQQVNIND